MEDSKLFQSTYFAAYSLKEEETAAKQLKSAVTPSTNETKQLNGISLAGHNLAGALEGGNSNFLQQKSLSYLLFYYLMKRLAL